MRTLLRISFFAVITLITLDEATGGDCPDKYLRYSNKHTYCKPPKDSCEIIEKGLKNGDKETLLRLHNEMRSKLARGEETQYKVPKAADMLQLVWDDELQELAQKHADQCTDEHDCKPCRRTNHYEVGQNIHKTDVKSPERDYEDAVKSFYSEVSRFDNKWIKLYDPKKSSGPTGHFTQLAWAKTWRMGCGYTAFKNGGSVSEVFVCDYGPTGNYLKQPMFVEGEPCGKCPENSECSSEYKGLCKVKDGKVPHYPREKEMVFHCDFTNEKDCKLVNDKKIPWKTEELYSGKHFTVVLEPGQSTKFGVNQNFAKPKPGLCLRFAYTKGPNEAGKKGKGNTAQQIYNFIGMRASPKINLPDSDKLMIHNMKLHFPRGFRFEVQFSVPKGSTTQYFDIEQFYITSGKGCK